MKTKILFLLTAIVLSCAGAYAQIEPLVGDVNEDNIVDVADIAAVVGIIKDGGSDMKGDINEDGVVSEDDIAAIIAIMKNGGGIVDNNYYWYVGYDQNAYDYPESFKTNMYTINTNAIPTQYSKSGDNGLDVSGTGIRPNYLIMITPSTWSKPTIYGQLKDAEITMTLEKQNVTITGISGVTFNVYSGTGEISDSKVFIN